MATITTITKIGDRAVRVEGDFGAAEPTRVRIEIRGEVKDVPKAAALGREGWFWSAGPPERVDIVVPKGNLQNDHRNPVRVRITDAAGEATSGTIELVRGDPDQPPADPRTRTRTDTTRPPDGGGDTMNLRDIVDLVKVLLPLITAGTATRENFAALQAAITALPEALKSAVTAGVPATQILTALTTIGDRLNGLPAAIAAANPQSDLAKVYKEAADMFKGMMAKAVDPMDQLNAMGDMTTKLGGAADKAAQARLDAVLAALPKAEAPSAQIRETGGVAVTLGAAADKAAADRLTAVLGVLPKVTDPGQLAKDMAKDQRDGAATLVDALLKSLPQAKAADPDEAAKIVTTLHGLVPAAPTAGDAVDLVQQLQGLVPVAPPEPTMAQRLADMQALANFANALPGGAGAVGAGGVPLVANNTVNAPLNGVKAVTRETTVFQWTTAIGFLLFCTLLGVFVTWLILRDPEPPPPPPPVVELATCASQDNLHSIDPSQPAAMPGVNCQ